MSKILLLYNSSIAYNPIDIRMELHVILFTQSNTKRLIITEIYWRDDEVELRIHDLFIDKSS